MSQVIPPEKLLKHRESIEVYERLIALTPASLLTNLIWKYFLALNETPRMSHKLELITQKVKEIADTLGATFKVDQAGNVILAKAGKGGKKGESPICIQAHLDMVCSKNRDSTHNFETDPVLTQIDSDWLKSKTGTTLGADDGIGVAAGLALLEHMSLPNAPIYPDLECLFTSNEETDMSGAANVDPTMLQSKVMINVDSEEEHSICFGCAGGFERVLHLPVSREDSVLEDSPIFKVAILGLAGGHTGAQIHEGLGNAIQIMARILRGCVLKGLGVSLISFEGGTAINSIPRECFATVRVTSNHDALFKSAFDHIFQEIAKEYKTREKNLKMNLELHPNDVPIPFGGKCVQVESTLKIFDVISAIPHGVIRMSPDVEGLVETSNALSIIQLRETEFELQIFTRSSSETQLELMAQNFDSLARLFQIKPTPNHNAFPGWLPDPQSPTLKLSEKIHEAVFQKKAHVYAVHAGLECGLIKNKYPQMDCISIGPEIKDAHSPDERLSIPSIPRFAAFLEALVSALAK